jgi:hypothetical protein
MFWNIYDDGVKMKICKFIVFEYSTTQEKHITICGLASKIVGCSGKKDDRLFCPLWKQRI